MRLANVSNRLVLLSADGGAIDVHAASGGQFEASPAEIGRAHV